MVRPRNIARTIRKHLTMREELLTAVELELFSEVEGRVPVGAWQDYIEGLVEDDLRQRSEQEKEHENE